MDEIDFGWFQPAEATGVRLTWDRATRILYLFHADTGFEEPLAVVNAATARRIGDRWLRMTDPISFAREEVTR